MKQCAWLTSPLPESLSDLVLLSSKSSLRLPLVLAVAASPRLAHLLADHAVHEEVCLMIPNYCRHTMLALYHLITTGATFSLNTRHMAELKEVCILLGFGQVAREKKDGGRIVQAVCTSTVPASVPSQHQSVTASVTGEDQDSLTNVTAGVDDLILASTRGEVSKISQPAVQCLPPPRTRTEYSAAVSDRDEGDDSCKEVTNEGSLKSRLRSSAVDATKKLAETAAGKRMKKSAQHEKAGRKQEAQCHSKPVQSAPEVTNSKLADPAAVQKQTVRQKSSGLDRNYNDCHEEKFKVRSKVVIGHHGKVLFKLRPRSVCTKYSGKRLLKFGGPESLEMLEGQIYPSKASKELISSVHTSAGCDPKLVIQKGNKSKGSKGNIELTQDAALKCSTRKKRSNISYTRLRCKKPKLNIPKLELKSTHPKPPCQTMSNLPSILSCPHCIKSSPSQSSIYPDVTSLRLHLTKMHFLQKICDLFPGPDKMCLLCTSSSKFHSKHLLAIHLGTVHSLCYLFVQEDFSCGICDQTFQHGGKFKMHLFTHYRSQLNEVFKEVIQCPFCPYWSTHDLPRHMGVFHGLVFRHYNPASFILKTPGNADTPGQNEEVAEVITLD